MPYFSYPQINLGFITVRTWGLFLGLAFVVSFILVLREAKKEKINQVDIINLSFLIFIGAVIGGRLGYVLQFPSYYIQNVKQIFDIFNGGMAFYGGLFTAIIFAYFYLKLKKLNFLQIADVIAPAAALGIFIGRLGCFLIKDHIGAVTNLPWGIVWPDNIVRHPVGLYLSLNGLVLFLILILFKKKSAFVKQGQLFFVFLFYYGLSRFLLDFFRAPFADPMWGFLFISQWISLAIILILILARRRYLSIIVSIFRIKDKNSDS